LRLGATHPKADPRTRLRRQSLRQECYDSATPPRPAVAGRRDTLRPSRRPKPSDSPPVVSKSGPESATMTREHEEVPSPSPGLAQLEADAREALHAEQVDTGVVRQAALIRLAGGAGASKNDPESVRGRLKGLLRAKLEAHPPNHPSPPSRNRYFSFEDAVRILTALWWMDVNPTLSPRAAANVIQAHFGNHAEPTGRDVLSTIIQFAMDRLDRIVIAQLLNALFFRELNLDRLHPGSIIILCRCRHGEAAPPARRADVVEWLRTATESKKIGVVNETHEVVFIGELDHSAITSRPFYRHTVLISAPYDYVLILSSPIPYSIAPLDTHNTMTREADYVSLKLIHAITEGFDLLQSSIESMISLGVQKLYSESILASSYRKDVLLWALTKLICMVAIPGQSSSPPVVQRNLARTRCVIFVPQVPPGHSSLRLIETSSSDIAPWEEEPNSEGVPILRMMSGYSWATHLPMAIRQTDSPYAYLVSNINADIVKMKRDTFSCFSLPVPNSYGDAVAQMYVSMPRTKSKEEFRNTILLLKMFTPIVGELIQRRNDIRATLANLSAINLWNFSESDPLRARMIDVLSPLINSLGSTGPGKGVGDRIAMVLLRPVDLRQSDEDKTLLTWLKRQLRDVDPHAFFGRWLGPRVRNTWAGEMVCGELRNGSVLMLLPLWLRKPELDFLRTSLPAQFNRIGQGDTELTTHKLQLNVWVIDLKWQELRRDPHPQVEATVDGMLKRAEAAEKVLHHIVDAHREHLAGNWRRALRHIELGLAGSPENAYLHRRASAFCARLLDFDAALGHAKRALDIDPESVSGHCLRGDALLALGKLPEALAAYRAAVKVDADHHLPRYAIGAALLIVARLLSHCLFEDLLRASGAGHGLADDAANDGPRMNVGHTQQIVQKLAEKAAQKIMQVSRIPERGDDLPSQHDPYKNVVVATALDLSTTDRLRGQPMASVRGAQAALEQSPQSDLLFRDLIWTSMWQRGVGTRLYGELLDCDTLTSILRSVDLED
jgi:hypothetical protein